MNRVLTLSIITKQSEANALPLMTLNYPYRKLNEGVVRVNIQLAEASQPLAISK